jgi:hypothetical protein
MKRIAVLFVLALVVLGCGKKKGADPEPAPAPPAPKHAGLPDAEDLSSYDGQYKNAVARALAGNLDKDGFVAVKKPDGSFDDQGDGAYFTGILLGSVDCQAGAALLATLVKDISDNGGMIGSHNPLLKEDRPTSRDQVTGVMFGLVQRWINCPADRPAITDAWAKHVAYVKGNDGLLGPTLDGEMLTLHWLWGAVGKFFGVDAAGGGSKPEFEAGIITTAAAVNATHSACYPVATGTLQAVTAAKIDKPLSDAGHDLFCAAARGLDLPLTDWFCGGKAATWLTSYAEDTWVYRHQRCPGWENPDANGNQTPGVDEMVSYELARTGSSW